MVDLTNVTGGAVIAASMAIGAADAGGVDSPLVVPVQQQPERVQLYDLPTVVLPNFFDPPEETFRNPSRRVINLYEYDSVGNLEERRPVTHGEREYDPVVQMVDTSGFGFCTATASTIEGFEQKSEGTIFTTAAHCLEITDKDHNVIGHRRPEDIFLYGSYLDENGAVKIFTMRADSIWQNPLYQENIDADNEFWEEHHYPHDLIFEGDTALIFSKQLLPYEVTPAVVLPIDFHDAAFIRNTLHNSKQAGEDIYVTVAGHSADYPYLTTHERALTSSVDYDGLTTQADIVPGASGGPVFISSREGDPIIASDNGEPYLLAVNSTLTKGTEFARHSYFNEQVLHTVPFLRENGTPANQFCYQNVEITATSLNILVGAGVSFQTLATYDGEENSRLPMGSSVMLHDTTRNELGQEWGLITTDTGRVGYISMNSDYVNVKPKQCFDFKF